jgi:hypothetical protein
MRESAAFRFRESEINIRIDVNDFSLKLLAGGENRRERFLSFRHVSIGRDHSRIADKKSASLRAWTFQEDNGWLRFFNHVLDSELGPQFHLRIARHRRRQRARERFGELFQCYVEMVGLEEKVFAVAAAVQADPFHGPGSEFNFFGGVSGERDPRNHGMFQARADGSLGLVKVSARKLFFVRRCSRDDAVNFDRCTRRRACDFQGIGNRVRGRGEQANSSSGKKKV